MDIEQEDGTKKKRVKHPVPDGYYTPTELQQHLAFYGVGPVSGIEASEEDKVHVGTATVYSWTRSKEDFPSEIHTDHRTIIPRDEGLAWVSAHLEEIKNKTKRKAANAAKREERLIKGVLNGNRTFAMAASVQ